MKNLLTYKNNWKKLILYKGYINEIIQDPKFFKNNNRLTAKLYVIQTICLKTANNHYNNLTSFFISLLVLFLFRQSQFYLILNLMGLTINLSICKIVLIIIKIAINLFKLFL